METTNSNKTVFCHGMLVIVLTVLNSLPTAPETHSTLTQAKSEFLNAVGSAYGYNGRIDTMYKEEIAPRLPPNSHYMDFTGSSLYLNSQVEAALQDLKTHVWGNPHSINPSSLLTGQHVEAVRAELLDFFSADPNEYTLVFTRSATAGMNLVGEAFPWSEKGYFVYLKSNHNSLLGIRGYAKEKNVPHGAVEIDEVERWLSSNSTFLPTLLPTSHDNMLAALSKVAAARKTVNSKSTAEDRQMDRQQRVQRKRSLQEVEGAPERDPGAPEVSYSMFGFPGYDNYAGVIFPLEWIEQVHAKSNATHQWKVLLDAAAFVPCHQLNLTEYKPDFVALSFYKLFGFPTGIGALLVRNTALNLLEKPYWGGGAIFLSTASLDWHLYEKPPFKFEDGTQNFLDIIMLSHGLNVIRSLGGPAITAHTDVLHQWLYKRAINLTHSNGAPLLKVIGLPQGYQGPLKQGATFNFEILKPNGQIFSYKVVGLELSAAGFHIRTGCMCNPGPCYNATGVYDWEVQALAEQHPLDENTWEWIEVQRPWGPQGTLVNTTLPLGSVRASLGYMSRFEDVYHFLDFLTKRYTDRSDDSKPLDVDGLPLKQEETGLPTYYPAC